MAGNKDTGKNSIFPILECSAGRAEANTSDLEKGRIQTVGIGLYEGEMLALDNLAVSLGVTRNQIMRLAIRKFLLDVRSGNFDPDQLVETPQFKKRVILPYER